MNPADEIAAKRDAAVDNLREQLSAVLESTGPSLQPNFIQEDEPVERVTGGKASYDRLVPIKKDMKRRGLRGAFTRYLVAILIGVAVTLAWQSYGDAAKQVIATSAPELGWSPETKQMIASWVQEIGWTKPPVGSEKQAAPVAQTAPAALSIDPEKVQQARDLATLRQTVEQLAADQDQMTREIRQILAKIPPAPAPPQPRTPPTSVAPKPPPHP
jgi:hypothetical protein